ncbi:MAG: hydroxymyristoyl-ACP dehydratase [Dysgonomonas sp.]|nr:hydroxymyristoyl-ACP dehydratase [Dysgonomonas sp.]
MLLNDFYKIVDLSKTEQGWVLHIELNPSHNLYKGHFPEQPIVPGVCTLQIIKENVENAVNEKFTFTRISSCKFLAAINPLTCKEVIFNILLDKVDDKNYTLVVDGIYQEKPCIKLKATLTTA